jgi:hypothetical protein
MNRSLANSSVFSRKPPKKKNRLRFKDSQAVWVGLISDGSKHEPIVTREGESPRSSRCSLRGQWYAKAVGQVPRDDEELRSSQGFPLVRQSAGNGCPHSARNLHRGRNAKSLQIRSYKCSSFLVFPVGNTLPKHPAERCDSFQSNTQSSQRACRELLEVTHTNITL